MVEVGEDGQERIYVPQPGQEQEREREGTEGEERLVGWRTAKEVVGFLRKRGAKIPMLGRRIEGEWAALSPDDSEDDDGGVKATVL